MQTHKKVIVLSVFIMLLSVVVSHAQQVVHPHGGPPGSWRVLGTTHAKHTADHDVITVAGPYDHFRKLKFKVTDAPLNMQRMVVTFDDHGAPENIELRFNIPKGGESRVIDLKGHDRKIRNVQFWYDTKGFLNGQADVTLFGMK